MANDNHQGEKYPDQGDGMSGKPPSWTKPGKGSFTGIDYNVAGVQTRSIEDSVEGGLRTTTISETIGDTDFKGRARETKTTTLVEGDTTRTA